MDKDVQLLNKDLLANYARYLLNLGESLSFNSNLVIRGYFTGNYNDENGLDADFKDCLFKNIRFDSTSFDYDDFKNTLFYKAKFSNCSFTHSDMSKCSFYECEFINCNLNESSLYDNQYTDTLFQRCSFLRVIMRSSQIINCQFNAIESSNRLFEDCLFFETNLSECQIYLSTIIYNYGLFTGSLSNYTVINDKSGSTLGIDEIKKSTEEGVYTPLELFRLKYFIESNFTSAEIDDLITLKTFIPETVSFQSFLFLYS